MIFMDHMMPEMDGIETKHEIDKRGLCVGVPIIMLTANAILEDREKYLEEGFDDFLSKPILVNKLEQILLKYLPKELIVEQNSNKIEEEKVKELPRIDEFHFDYALSMVQDEELLYKFLVDFQTTLEMVPQKLEKLYTEAIENSKLSEYRSEVHALKSTAATVGALLLSQTARLLEIAAIEEDMEKIQILHPVLMEELRKHRERVAEALQTNESKEQSGEIEAEYLDMLKAALQKEDYNVADFVCSEIRKKQYSEQIQGLVEVLSEQIFNLQSEKALETIRKIQG